MRDRTGYVITDFYSNMIHYLIETFHIYTEIQLLKRVVIAIQ